MDEENKFKNISNEQIQKSINQVLSELIGQEVTSDIKKISYGYEVPYHVANVGITLNHG